ncbi:MAG TPA: hypothetical protein PKY59_05135 [Pyrinomonadaceae bacterium]|nr:hypothetical protein [Pyrinomonadaceae bacterium]
MSANVTFDCFIKAKDTNWETFDFRMSDIYVSDLNKWIKADSQDDAKAFFNLEVLKTVRSFAFYTTSEHSARWSLKKKLTLKDFFDYKKSGSAFTLKIVAASNAFTWIIELRDCQPTASMLAPTPYGNVQAYSVKYANAVIVKHTVHNP